MVTVGTGNGEHKARSGSGFQDYLHVCTTRGGEERRHGVSLDCLDSHRVLSGRGEGGREQAKEGGRERGRAAVNGGHPTQCLFMSEGCYSPPPSWFPLGSKAGYGTDSSMGTRAFPSSNTDMQACTAY